MFSVGFSPKEKKKQPKNNNKTSTKTLELYPINHVKYYQLNKPLWYILAFCLVSNKRSVLIEEQILRGEWLPAGSPPRVQLRDHPQCLREWTTNKKLSLFLTCKQCVMCLRPHLLKAKTWINEQVKYHLNEPVKRLLVVLKKTGSFLNCCSDISPSECRVWRLHSSERETES